MDKSSDNTSTAVLARAHQLNMLEKLLLLREAQSSVRLDHGEDGTYAV